MRRKRGAVVCLGISSLPCVWNGEVGGGLNEGLVGVVHQLLRVRHLRVETGLNVQSVEGVRVGAVSLFLRDKVQEFAGSSDGLNLLFRRQPSPPVSGWY